MRFVLDTNVIISALLFGGAPEQLVHRLLVGEHDIVLSPYIIGETSRILKKKFGTQPDTINLLQQLLSSCELVYFEPYLHVLEDEPDNRVLETAHAGKADYLVTGDKPLLELKSYKTGKIITVRDCLKLL